MHHYPFHVGDYKAHSAHLDLLEDLAYRRMLDFVYLNEMPLPESIEEIARLICMRSNYDCITVVLREFFYRTDCGGWMNKRAALEISKYHEKSDKAKASIAARWDKVNKTKGLDDTIVLPTNYECNTNQNQNQNQNQKPINKVKEKTSSDKSDVALINKNPVMDADYLVNAFAVEKQIALDWLAVRKHKKASPLSETAIKLLINESAKAGITPAQAIAQAAGSGWISFKASYCDSGMQPTKAAFAAGDNKW